MTPMTATPFRSRAARLLVLLLTLAVSAACGAQPTEQPTAQSAQQQAIPEGHVNTASYKKEAPYTFCFSNASASNTWRYAMVEHVRYEVRQHPEIAVLHETDANDDPAKQIQDVEELLGKGCHVLLISPAKIDLKVVTDKAMQQGVPVVQIDRTVEGDNFVSYVRADNCDMGRLQAEWLVETLGGKGSIVLLSGSKGASAAEDRLRCAREVFTKHPDIKELAQAYANWNPVDGKKFMDDWIKQYPQIDGVWADGSQGVGAVKAYLEAGKPVPPITGCDINSYLKLWKEHNFDAMAVTYSARVGQLAVTTALDILAGKPVPHIVDMTEKVVTKANLDQFVRMDLPDGYWSDSDPAVVQLMFPAGK